MCNPAILLVAATAITAGGQIYGGLAGNSQAKYEANVATENARREELKIGDAQDRSRIEQLRRYRIASQAAGEQRAQAGLFGLDTTIGTTADLYNDTVRVASEDVYTIAENSRREIMGYDINAANFRSEAAGARARGKAAKISGFISAAGTIVGGAQQARLGGAPGKVPDAGSYASQTNINTYSGRGTIR